MKVKDISNMTNKERVENMDAIEHTMYRIFLDEGFEMNDLLNKANKHIAGMDNSSMYDYADAIRGDYGRGDREPIDIMNSFTKLIDSNITSIRQEIDMLSNEQKRAERIEELTRIADIVDYMQEEIGYKLQNQLNK